MKNTTCVVILAFALSSFGAAAQEKRKASPKPQPTTSQGKAQGKAVVKDGAEGTRRSVATQSPGSCSPDTTPPVIQSVTATPSVLGPPNHRMTPVSISANVTDSCSAVTWSVTAVASDEPVNGTGDGDTGPDWSTSGAHAVNLRSERAGTGDGRIYTITIVARDTAGNRASGTTTVSVPHSQKP
jgi:hypothetical protein